MGAGVHAHARSGCFIQRCHNKNPRKWMWPGTWVTSRTGNVGWDLKSQLVELSAAWGEDGWLSLACHGLVSGAHVVWGRWKSQVYFSPYVEKPLNSKVIKSLVPELRSRQVFFVFRDSNVLCIYVMNILCTFHIFMYGYVTCASWQPTHIYKYVYEMCVYYISHCANTFGESMNPTMGK